MTYEELMIDNYMEERGYSICLLYPADSWDELPTLSDWIDD